MKKCLYVYTFEVDDKFVLYSWLTDRYLDFSLKEKETVQGVLNSPEEVITKSERIILEKLLKAGCVISDNFNEFSHAMLDYRNYVHANDKLILTILPTLSCNCVCPYCYEFHPSLSYSKMDEEVVRRIKTFILKKISLLSFLKINWFGGEPLLCPDILYEITSYAKDLCLQNNIQFSCNITSNGVLLTESKIKMLTQIGIHELHLTIDGWEARHNELRVTQNKENTYNIIINNMKEYLLENVKNRVVLRIHVYNTDRVESAFSKINEFLDTIPLSLRKRISPYPHVIYPSKTERWGRSCGSKLENMGARDLCEKIVDSIIEKGFRPLIVGGRKNRFSCMFDLDWSWCILPNGNVSKCTVAVEPQRSVGRLTDKGEIQLFSRYFQFSAKNWEGSIEKECKNCHIFPLCFGGCPYQHYLRLQNKKKFLCKDMNSKKEWVFVRTLSFWRADYKWVNNNKEEILNAYR
ncbi:MAG: radical SAM protein [Treponemataceae bacterium]|nr:radical SAM protein [Treponemataceae bacterium]